MMYLLSILLFYPRVISVYPIIILERKRERERGADINALLLLELLFARIDDDDDDDDDDADDILDVLVRDGS